MQWPETALEKLLNRACDRFCAAAGSVPLATPFELDKITTAKYPWLPPREGEVSKTRIDAPQLPQRSAEKRFADSEAELHTIRRWKMLAHLRRLGGRVLAIQSRNECTPNHPSLRYFVTR